MRTEIGDVVLLRGTVTSLTEDGGLVVEYPGGDMRHPAPASAVAKIERSVITDGNKVEWTGRDKCTYRGRVLSLSPEPTGTVWVWVKCAEVTGGFATLKTSELTRIPE